MKKILLSLIAACMAAVNVNAEVLVSYAGEETLPAGVAIRGTTAQSAQKIHTNTDNVNCIQLKNGYTSSSAFNGNAIILSTEGGFKTGDIVAISGFFNNSDDTKVAKAEVFTMDADKKITVVGTTAQFINGRTNAANPTPDSITLTADADTIYIGRNGGTTTNISAISVTREEKITIAIDSISPAKDAELKTMPNIAVGFTQPESVGYVWYEINDLNPADPEDACLMAGELKKQENGSWATKFLDMYDIKLYDGHEYEIKLSVYASEDDKNYNNDPIAVLTSTVKGTTVAYQYSEAELSVVTPSTDATTVSGEITVVFTAAVDTLTAGISNGMMGDDTPCQVTPSEDKMTWTIQIPESILKNATGSLNMNVYAKDKSGKVVQGNAGEDADSYFAWTFNCYNGCPLPQKVTPATGSVVEKIDTIVIEDNAGIDISWASSLNIMVVKGKQVICTIPNDSVHVEEVALGATPKKITIVLPEAITTAGTYQVVFPVQYFIIGEQFDSKMSNSFIAEYTIEGEEPAPAPAAIVSKVRGSYMELTFTEWVSPSYNEKATVYNAANEVVASNCEGDFADDMNDFYSAKIKFGTDLAAGDYTVSIPAGMFVLGESGESMNEAMTLSFTVSDSGEPNPGTDPEPTTGDVTAISLTATGGTITFKDDIIFAGSAETVECDVNSADGTTKVATATISYATEYNVANVAFSEELADGDYQLDLAGKVLSLTTLKDITSDPVSFTIGAAPAVSFTTDPADGSTVEEIKKIVFTFTEAALADVVNGSAATVVDAEGNSAVKMTMLGWGKEENQLELDCTPVTAAGTYTITIPAGTITIDNNPSTADIVITLTIGGAAPAPALVDSVWGRYEDYSSAYPNYADADWGMEAGAKFKVEFYDNDSIVVRDWMNQGVDLYLTYNASKGTITSVNAPYDATYGYADVTGYYFYIYYSNSWYSASTKELFLYMYCGGYLYYHLTWEEETSLDCVESTEKSGKAVKCLENGKLVILKNGVKYNANGMQVK